VHIRPVVQGASQTARPIAPPALTASATAASVHEIQAVRALILVGLLAMAAAAWLLLRPRHRTERLEPPLWREERLGWHGTDGPPPPVGRGARRGPVSPTDVRLRQLFRRWLAWAGRHGLARLPTETAAEHMRRSLGAEPEGNVAVFLAAYEAARYGAADTLTPQEVAAAEVGFEEVVRRTGAGQGRAS
jgi:hypothetical protein